MKRKQVLEIIENHAQQVANKSPCRYQVACILATNKGKVVATGYNHYGQSCRMGNYTAHAEAIALNKVIKPSGNLVGIIYRDGMKPIDPCNSCEKLLDAYGIHEVWCSNGKGKVKRIKG